MSSRFRGATGGVLLVGHYWWGANLWGATGGVLLVGCYWWGANLWGATGGKWHPDSIRCSTPARYLFKPDATSCLDAGMLSQRIQYCQLQWGHDLSAMDICGTRQE